MTASTVSKETSADGALPSLRISIRDLEQFVVDVLKQFGMTLADAQTTAAVLVTTDAWGVFTHGTKLLAGYAKRLRAGGLVATAAPEVVREGLGWATLDGHSSIGMVTSVAAMDIAIKKARQAGIGMAGVYNSCHFGAAGYYAVMAARAGLIGLVTSNDIPSMTAPGARGRIMGTNPFAFAAPAGEEKPIFLDMAMSTVAGGKVHAAKLLGKTIPDNWLVDENGLHTNNPADFDKGALQPMGAHKGYGLALMAETLAGLLTGAQIRNEVLAWMGNEPSRPTGHGACFIAIDVASMLPIDAFRQRMDAMIRDIRAQPKATGMDRIYMPGELEWGREEKAAREGILLPPDVAQLLSALASETGVRLKSMQ